MANTPHGSRERGSRRAKHPASNAAHPPVYRTQGQAASGEATGTCHMCTTIKQKLINTKVNEKECNVLGLTHCKAVVRLRLRGTTCR